MEVCCCPARLKAYSVIMTHALGFNPPQLNTHMLVNAVIPQGAALNRVSHMNFVCRSVSNTAALVYVFEMSVQN